MRRPALLCLAALLALVHPAAARPGEMAGALAIRYGAPVAAAKPALIPPATSAATYRTKDLTITVYFWQGRSALEVYETTAFTSSPGWKPDEEAAVRRDLGEGKDWTFDAEAKVWRRNDGKLVMRFPGSLNKLAVATTAFDNAALAAKAAKPVIP